MFKGSCKKRIIFSIIIPLYNKEKFISKTLQSVLSQLDIFELIIINDSSTDNSLKICKKFKKKNKLIKIINPKRKLYVSEARNLGIKKSSGEYLIFLDADDIIGKNFLKNLNNIIKNNKYDLIINDLGDLRKGKSYSFKNNFIKKLILSKFVGYCWRNIYRRNFLNKNNIYFNKNILVCEDEEFVSRCFLKSRKIHFLDKNYYHKTSEPKSLSHVNLGQNFYGLDLENFLKSYLNVLISLSRNLKKIKNNKPLKFYFQNRVKLMLNKIYPLIMLSDDIQLKKISNQFSLYSKFFSNNLFLLKQKKLDLLNSKIILKKKFSKFFDKFRSYKFYLFCYDHITFSIIKLMKEKKIKIVGILDNNYKNFPKNFNVFNIRLKNINKESLKIKNEGKMIVLILNQKKENILGISKQLKDLGIKKNKIKNFLFYF